MNVEEWVNNQINSLDQTPDWRPNAGYAMARLRARREGKTRDPRRLIWAAGATAIAMLMLVAIPSRGTCAQSVLGLKCAAPAVAAATPGVIRNFKESGAPAAPITIEIYSDYECPSCAEFFAQTLPPLVEKYVKTGRVKLLHRDFPLPQHLYARLAARYANAAGELGFYDVVTTRLFTTQAAWERNGAVDREVMQVVPPGAMTRLREIVKSDARLDDTVNTDAVAAGKDGIDRTPTLVFVYKGRREKVIPTGSFALLERYLDQLPVN